jgi:phosphatidylserine/phosphatidylglycerophosphate/cardiolipin synthase-like enzyme
MRFKSEKTNGFQVFAVSGVHTVSFGIDATAKAKKGLLGFGVKRRDPSGKTKTIRGFKVFKSIIPKPDEKTRVFTTEHPVQSFVWDDFTTEPGAKYEYQFIPMKGEPAAMEALEPIVIAIETEPLFSGGEHDVFFNRGVASSQAYTREFGNRKPDDMPEELQARALEWLGRRLDEALLDFVKQAEKGDALRCCFYEFRYPPVLEELKNAIDRGVDVKIIIDAKNKATKDKDGNPAPPFPREENLKCIETAGIPEENIIKREARASKIQHNKFMVLLKKKGKKLVPAEVWTGSTNISDGGIHGQTNVGHWVRNAGIAENFLDYWTLLSDDPGSQDGDAAGDARKKNAALKEAVEALDAVPSELKKVKKGITAVFSPRTDTTVLDFYFDLIDTAKSSGCITLAFGVSDDFKEKLVQHTADSQIVFLLLEKEDKPKKGKEFVKLNATNNVYQAFGAFLDDPVYQWARETNTRKLQLNSHVMYIHSKFLLRDPLGTDPIVVTGSANFSLASTEENDENMLIIRGNPRVADIYFTEFNRLFNHYYFRAVHQQTKDTGSADVAASLFLDEDDGWLEKYKPGKLKQKRLDLYTRMKGFA